MLRVTGQVTVITGERYWAPDAQLPAQVQTAVNINIVGIDRKGDSSAEDPFVVTVAYTPSIAQLSIKGKAQISGEGTEILQIVEENKKNKPPPATVIQAVSSVTMADAIVISKSLGIPPPLPPIGIPAEASLPQPSRKKRVKIHHIAKVPSRCSLAFVQNIGDM